MSTATAQQVSSIDQVRDWLLSYKPKSRENQFEEIDLDMDLIENRVIDSLDFMDFIFFLEELAGRELLSEAQSVHNFRSLRVIREKILDGGA